MTSTTSQQPSSENVWGQAGAKTQPNSSAPPPPPPPTPSQSSTQSTNNSSSTTKQQLEQLQALREAIFSQDGWGVVSGLLFFQKY